MVTSTINMRPAESRLIGNLPKIRIGPIIDGRRRGVREYLLEEPTLALARAAAALLTSNLRHANGLPVECVVPDFCIGGARSGSCG